MVGLSSIATKLRIKEFCMKITVSQLRRIIKEEVQKTLNDMPVVKDAERVLMMLLKQAPYQDSITLSLKNIADLGITPEELQAAKDFALGTHNVEGISFNDDGTVSVEYQ